MIIKTINELFGFGRKKRKARFINNDELTGIITPQKRTRLNVKYNSEFHDNNGDGTDYRVTLNFRGYSPIELDPISMYWDLETAKNIAYYAVEYLLSHEVHGMKLLDALNYKHSNSVKQFKVRQDAQRILDNLIQKLER